MAGNHRKFTASFKAHVVKQALREDVSLAVSMHAWSTCIGYYSLEARSIAIY